MMVKAQYSQPPCCCCSWKILENKTLPVCMLKLTFGFVFFTNDQQKRTGRIIQTDQRGESGKLFAVNLVEL